MGGNTHYRTGAVIGQHIVGGPDRQFLAGQRVDGVASQEDSGTLTIGGLPLDLRDAAELVAVGLQLGPLSIGDQLQGKIRVRGHHHERHTVERVGTGGEDTDRLTAFNLVGHLRAGGAADPVALHSQHAFGPGALQLLHILQQPVSVFGDLEVPLVQGLLGDGGSATLADAVAHYLLIGQHRLILRAPVDRRVLPVGQPAVVELQEQPLGPPVVERVGGVQPAGPVHGEAVAFEAGGLGLDVVVGPFGRVRVVLDRGVLCGQAEGVPADRVQHVIAAQPGVAGRHISDGEGLGVAHVQVPRGVGEHIADVLFRPLVGGVDHKRAVLFPERKPAGFDLTEVVGLLLSVGLAHLWGTSRS